MQPGQPKKSNALVIVLAVFGVLGLLVLGTCAVGVFWIKDKADEMIDGGSLVLASPPEVVAALQQSGPKRAYVGVWKSDAGSTLSIDEAGNMMLDWREAGSSKRLQAPIAAFSGNDIQMKALVTITIAVSEPPAQSSVGGKWQMTADRVRFVRD